MSVLSATGLGLHVGDATDGRWLVRHLDIELSPGEVTAVIGPNGSGKSTLLKALCGLTRPREGAVCLDGREVARWDPRQRARQLAYLPQSTPLVHDLRVLDIVALGRAPYRGRWPLGEADTKPRALAALRRVGAQSLAERRASTLSGGERQRVMIARMLATGATHLMMDEPSAALDVGHALNLHALLRDLATEGAAVLVAIHDLDAARDLADRAICLDRRAGGGAHHLGPAREVLGPEVLADAFDVQVRESDGALRFARR